MPAYAVLEPPRRNRSATDHTDRFVFVREKFSIWAFLFGALWMIWRRLWLVLLVYLVAMGVIGYGLERLEIAWPARAAIYVLIQFLIGLEAVSLRRWTLVRRGWRDRGIVIGDDIESAERRFFDARPSRPASDPLMPASTPMLAPDLGPHRPDIIGLFPEPEAGGERRHHRLRLRQSALGRQGVRARGTRERRATVDCGDQ